jgi:L-alanine-DL-glutamate epimerase-like enolase superfamily enzyme
VTAYERIADLALEVESYSLDRLETQVTSDFMRVTTVVRLRGRGEEGVGEDVTYDGRLHPPPADLPLDRVRTFDELSSLLEGRDLFPGAEVSMGAFRFYRRWAFESAALDLALRQAGTSLADALGREPRPVTFVVSTRLPDPPSGASLLRLIARFPGTRFKLDPTSDWDDDVVAEVAATQAVDTVDLKGAYKGTVVDQPPDPELYARVAAGFPEAWIEDPALTEETDPVLAPYRDRITWDAPIHSVADIEALPFPPRTINVKPSRFGSVRGLLEAYEYLGANGMGAYGGGQFELGPGRGQIQYLASLFHPDAPNDVAPSGYNAPDPGDGLPLSPLAPAPGATGFRWGGPSP